MMIAAPAAAAGTARRRLLLLPSLLSPSASSSCSCSSSSSSSYSSYSSFSAFSAFSSSASYSSPSPSSSASSCRWSSSSSAAATAIVSHSSTMRSGFLSFVPTTTRSWLAPSPAPVAPARQCPRSSSSSSFTTTTAAAAASSFCSLPVLSPTTKAAAVTRLPHNGAARLVSAFSTSTSTTAAAAAATPASASPAEKEPATPVSPGEAIGDAAAVAAASTTAATTTATTTTATTTTTEQPQQQQQPPSPPAKPKIDPDHEKTPTHGSYIWDAERSLSLLTVPLLASGFIFGPVSLVDFALGFVLPLHAYLGFETILHDYLPRRRAPRAHWYALRSLQLATALTIYGLFEFNTNEVGLTAFVMRVWTVCSLFMALYFVKRGSGGVESCFGGRD